LLTAHSVFGKKPNTFAIRDQVIKKPFFGSVPKSHTQMGSLIVKNASEILTLGDLNHSKLNQISLSGVKCVCSSLGMVNELNEKLSISSVYQCGCTEP
jgi:hypothetical protein